MNGSLSDLELVTEPTTLLTRAVVSGKLDSKYRHPGSFHLGRLSVALEMITQMKLLDSLGGSSLLAMEKEEIISVMQSFLVNLNLVDEALELYQWLGKYQHDLTLRFEAV